MLTIAKRLLTEAHPRLLWKFAWNFGFQGARSIHAFKRRLRRGELFPPFMFISVTNACNLRCRGCWVNVGGEAVHMPPGMLDKILRDAKRRSVRFFGILGGEPLLHESLFRVLRRHPDCYFQVFTNGSLLDERAADEMRRLGNVTPLISIEGLEAESDRRRGGTGVYGHALDALEMCRSRGLIFGVATSVCRSNIGELATREFVEDVARRGAHYLWYYIYRPSGADPSPELALDREQILRLRRFIVEQRRTAPLAVVDSYWDAEGRALCPAAVGMSYHINPEGFIEPCPPIQFARERVTKNEDLFDTINNSEFLREFAKTVTETSRGCILLEDPERLLKFVEESGARDTSGRDARAELAAMRRLCSHHLPGEEIPEESWAYRFGKKNWFFGFGAYG